MNGAYAGFGIGLGLCSGVALGAALQNIGVGISLGVALGAAFSLIGAASASTKVTKKPLDPTKLTRLGL